MNENKQIKNKQRTHIPSPHTQISTPQIHKTEQKIIEKHRTIKF